MGINLWVWSLTDLYGHIGHVWTNYHILFRHIAHVWTYHYILYGNLGHVWTHYDLCMNAIDFSYGHLGHVLSHHLCGHIMTFCVDF